MYQMCAEWYSELHLQNLVRQEQCVKYREFSYYFHIR